MALFGLQKDLVHGIRGAPLGSLRKAEDMLSSLLRKRGQIDKTESGLEEAEWE